MINKVCRREVVYGIVFNFWDIKVLFCCERIKFLGEIYIVFVLLFYVKVK